MKNIKRTPDGSQGIILVYPENGKVGKNFNIFHLRFLVVCDRDDRGTGTGILKRGLPGGTIEFGETPSQTFLREIKEEVNLVEIRNFKPVNCFPKNRPDGTTNRNHLFVCRLYGEPKLVTNDEKEVSKVEILSFYEIIDFASKGFFHEGSIRLIFHFLNGTSGLLNEPVRLRNYNLRF